MDHNEHDRLLRSIKDGENEMLDMWQEGDGEQDAMFFKRGPSEQIRHVSSSPGKSRSRQGAHLNSTVYRRHLYQAGHSNSADIQWVHKRIHIWIYVRVTFWLECTRLPQQWLQCYVSALCLEASGTFTNPQGVCTNQQQCSMAAKPPTGSTPPLQGSCSSRDQRTLFSR